MDNNSYKESWNNFGPNVLSVVLVITFYQQYIMVFETLNIFPKGSYVKTLLDYGGHLGWLAEMSDITLKGDHTRPIPPEFGPTWPSNFRGQKFKHFSHRVLC